MFQVKDANNGTASSLSLSITVSGSTACIAPTPVNPAVSSIFSCTNSIRAAWMALLEVEVDLSDDTDGPAHGP